jgi:hypothetical protein
MLGGKEVGKLGSKEEVGRCAASPEAALLAPLRVIFLIIKLFLRIAIPKQSFQ